MPTEETHTRKTTISTVTSITSVGKDLVSLLRDAALFLLAVLLVAFPSTFNSMLTDAGFEEGSFVGFKWRTKFVESDTALQQAAGTISGLQTKNDELVKALGEAKVTDPSLNERFGKLEQDNDRLRQNTQQVQESVSETVVSNAPLVEQALSSSALVRTRSDYLVGVQTLGVSDAVRQDLNAKLRNAGYKLHQLSASYEERQSFLAQRSTVLYYARSAESAARELAGVLTDLTGEDFAVQSGRGLGVDPAQRGVTLFAHYIKN